MPKQKAKKVKGKESKEEKKEEPKKEDAQDDCMHSSTPLGIKSNAHSG